MKKMISCITAAVLFCTAIIPAAAESAEPENPTILRDESAMFCDIIPLFEQKCKEMSPEEQAHYDFFYTPDSSSGYNHPKDDTLANGWGASLWLSYTDSAVCGFKLSSYKDREAAEDIVASCFPDDDPFAFVMVSTDKYLGEYASVFTISDRRKGQTKAQNLETADLLRQKLTDSGLAYEFYMPEQTVYCDLDVHIPYLTAYGKSSEFNEKATAFDEAAAEALIAEQKLDCTVKKEPNTRGEYDYYVVPNKPVSVEEHWALAQTLYQSLGIVPKASGGVSAWGPHITFLQPVQKQPNTGDINTDGDVDVSDAVLLARFIAEDASADISQAGLMIADVNGDGMRSADDVITILQMIVKTV